MRWRWFLLVSLVVNLALAVALLVYQRHLAVSFSVGSANRAPTVITNAARPNVVIRRQFFSWREVESSDYPTYIANLRDIGCPESTIRDIIVADVNQLYALKRATEIVTAEQQWWRSEPDPAVVQVAESRLRALDDERRALLTRLLGSKWESEDALNLALLQPRLGIALDGPVLGTLPANVKLSVREIAARQQQKTLDYLEARNREGELPDAVALARIRQQTRDELAKVLAPAQLEEFLLRYSDNAQRLRAEIGDLRFFNATPDEFRALFRARDSIDQQIALAGSGDDAASAQRRQALEEERETAIKNTLGPKRYAEYRQLHDPVYRDAMAAAAAAGAPASASALYEIARATAQERQRVEDNRDLTTAQREIELKRIELEQLKANSLALGQSLPAEPTAPPAPRVVHVIEPGETIDKLSARYGISIRDILSANANKDFDRLKPGDAIYVPAGSSGK